MKHIIALLSLLTLTSNALAQELSTELLEYRKQANSELTSTATPNINASTIKKIEEEYQTYQNNTLLPMLEGFSKMAKAKKGEFIYAEQAYKAIFATDAYATRTLQLLTDKRELDKNDHQIIAALLGIYFSIDIFVYLIEEVGFSNTTHGLFRDNEALRDEYSDFAYETRQSMDVIKGRIQQTALLHAKHLL